MSRAAQRNSYRPGCCYIRRRPGEDAGSLVVVALESEKMERFKMLFYEAVVKEN